MKDGIVPASPGAARLIEAALEAITRAKDQTRHRLQPSKPHCAEDCPRCDLIRAIAILDGRILILGAPTPVTPKTPNQEPTHD